MNGRKAEAVEGDCNGKAGILIVYPMCRFNEQKGRPKE
jgi:hypothetical protein